jgi:hypothetical protein
MISIGDGAVMTGEGDGDDYIEITPLLSRRLPARLRRNP